VRSDGVVLPPPSCDQDLGFRQRIEDLAVEQFITQFPVKRFHKGVLPRIFRFDEQRLDLRAVKLEPDKLRRERRIIVQTDVDGDPMRNEQVREPLEHVGRAQPPVPVGHRFVWRVGNTGSTGFSAGGA